MKYRAPRLTTYGTIADITRGQDQGDSTDQQFPVGTPEPDLTFSEFPAT